MSDGDLYLWYGRVIKQKQVDKELKKIGTWRDKVSPIELAIIALLIAGLVGTAIYCKLNKANKPKGSIEKVMHDFTQYKTR